MKTIFNSQLSIFNCLLAQTHGRASLLLLATAYCLLATLPAVAQDDPTYAYFIGSKFNAGNASGDGTKTMKLNNGAALTTDNGGAIRIVPDAQKRTGSAFLSRPIYSETGFSAMFEIFLGTANNHNKDWDVGDGWSFIVSKGISNTGDWGGGLGYTSIPNSFALGFDLASNECSKCAYDSNYVPALRLGLNGTFTVSEKDAPKLAPDTPGIPFSAEEVNALKGADIKISGSLVKARNYSLYCWVDYNVAEDYLDFYVNIFPVKPDTPVIRKGTPGTADNDATGIPESVGTSYYIGYTASTGGAVQQTDLRQFYVLNRFAPGAIAFNDKGTGYDAEDITLVEDFTAPSAPVITQSDIGMTPELMVFSVGGSDDLNGIMKYQYRITNSADSAWHNYTDADGRFVLNGARLITTPITTGGSVTVYARAIDNASIISAETGATLKYDIRPNPVMTQPTDGATGLFPEQVPELVLTFASPINAATVGTVAVEDANNTAAAFAGAALVVNDPRWSASHDKLEMPFASGAIGYGQTYTVTVAGFVNTSGNTMDPAAATFTFSTIAREATPTAAIDYAKEQLTGLTSDVVYRVNGTEYTATSGVIALQPAWLGATIQIVKPGTANTAESAAQLLDVPARPAAPTTLSNATGPSRITGTTTGMEYATSAAATTWMPCTESSTTVDEGTYYVRLKSTGSAFRSDAARVEVQVTSYALNLAAPAFDIISFGDAQPAAQPLTILSSGNSNATIASVVSSNSSFTVSGSGTTVSAGGSITSWTVQPVAGLPVGVHSATITVTYNNDATATAAVSLAVREATPAIVIDYVKEQLTGFVPNDVYTINGETKTTGTGNLSIVNAQLGMAQVIIKTNANTALNSLSQTLNIPVRPAPPAGVAAGDEPYAGGNGNLTGVTADMEYRPAGGAWTDGAADGVIVDLAPGAYEVRVKAVAGANFRSQSEVRTIASSSHKVNLAVCVGKGYALTSKNDGSGTGLTYTWSETPGNSVPIRIEGANEASYYVVNGKNEPGVWSYMRWASSNDCEGVPANVITVGVRLCK